MSGFSAKLSKHVLGMKFMRKTKDQAEKEKVEKIHREHFVPVTSKTEDETSINQPEISSSVVIEELWSYNQCKKFVFGRQSYGGFNPAVETNVKKGVWRPFYLDEAANLLNDSEDEGLQQEKDVDVSDEEMAKTFGSLVGTLAKHFRRKHKKEAEAEEEGDNETAGDNTGNQDHTQPRQKKNWKHKFQGNKNNRHGSNDVANQQNQCNNAQDKRKKIRRGGKFGNKRQRESTGSTYHYQQRHNSSSPAPVKKSPFSTPSSSTKTPKRGEDLRESIPPPSKKRKFMKPSD